MSYNLDEKTQNALFEYLLRLGDDRLILGHRLSEWCGHAPVLEEDIALGNIALDLIGQSSAYLSLAAEVENKNRTEDDLAYFRNEYEFKNLQLVEQPNVDFAYTVIRQYLFDVYESLFLTGLSKSKFEQLAGIAEKSIKENKYHTRHSKQWVLRLGDGTEESRNKIQTALNDLWRFTGELFEETEVDEILKEKKFVPDLKSLKENWNEIINSTFKEATLTIPEGNDFASGGRGGIHTEHLGHLLAEMQIVARSYPGVKW